MGRVKCIVFVIFNLARLLNWTDVILKWPSSSNCPELSDTCTILWKFEVWYTFPWGEVVLVKKLGPSNTGNVFVVVFQWSNTTWQILLTFIKNTKTVFVFMKLIWDRRINLLETVWWLWTEPVSMTQNVVLTAKVMYKCTNAPICTMLTFGKISSLECWPQYHRNSWWRNFSLRGNKYWKIERFPFMQSSPLVKYSSNACPMSTAKNAQNILQKEYNPSTLLSFWYQIHLTMIGRPTAEKINIEIHFYCSCCSVNLCCVLTWWYKSVAVRYEISWLFLLKFQKIYESQRIIWELL